MSDPQSQLGRVAAVPASSPQQVTALGCRAWHDEGIVVLRPADVQDPALRKALVEAADQRYGRRQD